MDATERSELLNLIKDNPDEILNNENSLKLVIGDPELSSLLVENKNEPQLIVTVDNNTVKLKRSVNPMAPQISNYPINTLPKK